MINTGGVEEAVTRAVLYVIEAAGGLDQRSAFALKAAHRQLPPRSTEEFKSLVRNQFLVLALQPTQALAALARIIPEKDARLEVMTRTQAVVSAGGPPTTGEQQRLDELSRVLGSNVQAFAEPVSGNMATAAE